jgi:predicted lysophospholipase L1 biosynthesis ABC-type transport system permease subunit
MHSRDETLEVVGVARDSFVTWGHEPDEPVVYRPLSALDSRSILVRFVGDGTGLAAAVRGITRELFPDAFDNPRTLASILEESRTWLRTVGNLLSVLGIVALGMALIGVYGAVSFSVGERQRELALRTALGARASDLFYRVLGLHWKPVAIGILVGLPLAVAGGMIFNSQLHARLRTDDPLLFAGLSIALVASSLLATLAPARKGISSDPMQALREE